MPSEGVAVVGRVCLPGELLGRAHELQLSVVCLPDAPAAWAAHCSKQPGACIPKKRNRGLVSRAPGSLATLDLLSIPPPPAPSPPSLLGLHRAKDWPKPEGRRGLSTPWFNDGVEEAEEKAAERAPPTPLHPRHPRRPARQLHLR
jgi:hypothetical protein